MIVNVLRSFLHWIKSKTFFFFVWTKTYFEIYERWSYFSHWSKFYINTKNWWTFETTTSIFFLYQTFQKFHEFVLCSHNRKTNDRCESKKNIVIYRRSFALTFQKIKTSLRWFNDFRRYRNENKKNINSWFIIEHTEFAKNAFEKSFQIRIESIKNRCKINSFWKTSTNVR